MKKVFTNRNLTGSTLVWVLLYLYKVFWLPGFRFNSNIWDDENRFVSQVLGKSFLNNLFHRDAPGYWIFLNRIISWIDVSVFNNSAFAIRNVVIVMILFSSYFGAKLLCEFTGEIAPTTRNFYFIVLTVIPIEDLNYLHNVGYLFFLPIFWFILNARNFKIKKLIFLGLLILILLNKPIVALLTIVLVIVTYLNLRKKVSKEYKIFLISIAFYSFIYLIVYFVLPHEWDTPVTRNTSFVFPAFANFPFLLASIIFPSIYIGALGFLIKFKLSSIIWVFGIGIYLVPILILFLAFFKKKLPAIRDRLVLLILGLLGTEYLSVYSLSNSYWITKFPLWNIQVPQHLFMRWSALFPYLGIFFIGRIFSVSNRNTYFKVLMLFIMIQNILLSILAHNFLIRYW